MRSSYSTALPFPSHSHHKNCTSHSKRSFLEKNSDYFKKILTHKNLLKPYPINPYGISWKCVNTSHYFLKLFWEPKDFQFSAFEGFSHDGTVAFCDTDKTTSVLSFEHNVYFLPYDKWSCECPYNHKA